MRRKVVSLVLTMCLLLVAFSPALAEYDPNQNYSISFYFWDEGQKPGMDAMVDLFESQYPNIDVESTLIPWGQYWTKLTTSLPSGTGPDVFWMNLRITDFIDADLIVDITDMAAEAGIDFSKFPQGVVDLYTIDGRIYGIPKDFDSDAICYNKAIFDELGVPYPTSDWTLEEFLATAEALTKDGYYGFYASSAFNTDMGGFVYGNDGTMSNEDHTISTCNCPETVEMIQMMHDMMYVSKVSPNGAEQSEMSQDDMFITGLVAMVGAGSWSISTYYEALGEDLGVVEFPTIKDKGNVTNGLCFSMASMSPNADAAWEFMKFCATLEAQAATAEVVIPAYEGSYQSWIDSYPDVDVQCYIDALEYAELNPQYAKNRTECGTVFSEAIATIWLDENADIQAILDAAQADIQALLDAE